MNLADELEAEMLKWENPPSLTLSCEQIGRIIRELRAPRQQPAEVSELVERLRATGENINHDHIDANMREIYLKRRAEEIESFLFAIGRDHIAEQSAGPLRYVAQMLSAISMFASQFGSQHHATALAAETALFYADALASRAG